MEGESLNMFDIEEAELGSGGMLAVEHGRMITRADEPVTFRFRFGPAGR